MRNAVWWTDPIKKIKRAFGPVCSGCGTYPCNGSTKSCPNY